MGKVTTHPAIAEFAARQNADALVEQHRQHQEELRVLYAENGRLKKERNALRSYVGEMEEAVIEFKGEPRTLISIWEAGEYRKLCLTCRKPECEGEVLR